MPGFPQGVVPKAPPNRGPVDPSTVTASQLIDDNAPWLPPEPDRKAAFINVFRYWHNMVRPEFRDKATPAFLFLVTALPMMIQSRDHLKDKNLWEPPGEQSRQARDVHPSWKRYCELLPRAQQALQEIDLYRHLSLLTALDELQTRVTRAEKRYREGDKPPARGRR